MSRLFREEWIFTAPEKIILSISYNVDFNQVGNPQAFWLSFDDPNRISDFLSHLIQAYHLIRFLKYEDFYSVHIEKLRDALQERKITI